MVSFSSVFRVLNNLFSGVDPDDELDSQLTDAQGNFELQGSTREMTNIDPRLKIYHDCNDNLVSRYNAKQSKYNSFRVYAKVFVNFSF